MSSYIVSARKYRPLRFDGVVGQEHVTKTLKNAMKSDHVAHAFLFCGPRGVGKTTCARILAKALNCLNRSEDFEPCNDCMSCNAFNRQASFNIIELDGASNNKVEHIRELIDQVRVPPQTGTKKVFIIDEVHMLSLSAFNAFLKTLEEPPPHATFILATTEKHKLLPTILSRCQIFDFKRIRVPEIMEHLEWICKQEGIEADLDALRLIAQKADGALRDALSIFDRVAGFSGGKISYEAALENLRALGFEVFHALVDAMLLSDLPTVLQTLESVINDGFEAVHLLQGLGEHFRYLLMCKNPKTADLLQVGKARKKKYLQQANACPYFFIISAFDIINEADKYYSVVKHKRLHIETCLCRLTYLNQRERFVLQESGDEKKKLITQDNPPVSDGVSADTTPKPFVQEEESKTADSAEEKREKSGSMPSGPQEIGATGGSLQNAQNLPKPKKAVSGFDPIIGLDELDRDVEEEIAIKKPEQALILEQLQNIWDAYAEEVRSPSLKNTLKKAELFIVSDAEIKVKVTGKIAKTTIQHERELLQLIRQHFNRSQLQYSFEIVEDVTDDEYIEKPKYLLSSKEKFEIMCKENPKVLDLVKRLNLHIDN